MKKYEFLYSDTKKFVPIELKKINYGYAPLKGLRPADFVTTDVTINLEFPEAPFRYQQGYIERVEYLGGIVVLLIKENDNEKIIYDVNVLPIGETATSFEVKNVSSTDKYYLYMISEKYKDSWIGRTTSGNYILLDEEYYDQNRGIIHIDMSSETVNIVLDENSGWYYEADDKNINEWYNWQGSYTNPNLIFFPDITGGISGYENATFGIDSLFTPIYEARGSVPFTSNLRVQTNGTQRLIELPGVWDQDGDSPQSWAEMEPEIKFISGLGNTTNKENYVKIEAYRSQGSPIERRTTYFKIIGNGGDGEVILDLPSNVNFDGRAGYTYAIRPGIISPGNAPEDMVPMYKVNYQYTIEIPGQGGEDAQSTFETRNGWRYSTSPNPEFEDLGYSYFYAPWNSTAVVTSVEPLFYGVTSNYQYSHEEATGGDDEVGPGDGFVQELGQLAIMQNIRFLKKMLDGVNQDLWNTMQTTISFLSKRLETVTGAVDGFDDTNAIISNISPRITNTMVHVTANEITEAGVSNDAWTNVDTFQTDPNYGLLTIDVSTYTEPGKYLIAVKPLEFELEIGAINEDLFLIPQANATNAPIMSDDYVGANFFYGWNIEFFNTAGVPLGETKKIVGSRHDSQGQTFKISPIPINSFNYNPENLTARIWSDSFESQIVQVNILEHNSETLSYSLYGKRSMNRTSGLMTIYDHNGNVYKEFSMGTVSNNNTGGDIIDYRCNVEDEVCFSGV